MISTVVLRTQSDAKLAAMASGGSDAAFEAIVRRYRRALVCYCRRLLLSEPRSEDVVQQVFLNAWSALRAGVEVSELKAWLHRITHNEAVSALRRPEHDFDELNDSIRGADAPESDLERRMLMRETLAAVAALPELQREAILRTAIEGQSYDDVAAALGLTDNSVRGLIYRARASLRAGMAALAPHPLVLWAAGQGDRTGLNRRLSEVLGGGSAGGAAFMIKSATVVATSAVVVGGTVGGALSRLAPSLPPPPAPPISLIHHPTARSAARSLRRDGERRTVGTPDADRVATAATRGVAGVSVDATVHAASWHGSGLVQSPLRARLTPAPYSSTAGLRASRSGGEAGGSSPREPGAGSPGASSPRASGSFSSGGGSSSSGASGSPSSQPGPHRASGGGWSSPSDGQMF